jgi:plastocyanin
MSKQKTLLLAALGVLVLALAGCGSSSTSSSNQTDSATKAAQSGATQSTAAGKGLALAADPNGNFKYDKTSLSAAAGDVSIDFTNDSTTQHNVTVQDSSGAKLGATKTIAQSTATVDLGKLKAGTYTFFCSIPGHEQAGMKGTLTVK